MFGILISIVSSLAYGSSGIFARLGLQYIKPLPGAVISLVASVALGLIVTFWTDAHAFVTISLIAVLWFSLVGLVHFAFGRYFNYLGVGYIGASRAGTLRASSPLFSMILAIAFVGEMPNALILVGTLMIALGLYVMVRTSNP